MNITPRHIRFMDLRILGSPACPWCQGELRRIARSGKGACNICERTVNALDVLVVTKGMTLQESCSYMADLLRNQKGD